MTPSGFDRPDLLAIAVGGVAGAALRWVIGQGLSNQTFGVTLGTGLQGFTAVPSETTTPLLADGFGFPWATLVANVAGCLILGAVLFWRSRAQGPQRLLLGASTGFCGSLTTFSTFAVEVASRLRSSQLTLPVRNATSDSGQFVELQLSNSPAAQTVVYAAVSLAAGAAAFWLGRTFAATNLARRGLVR